MRAVGLPAGFCEYICVLYVAMQGNPWLLYWGAIADFHPAPALLQPHTGHVEQEELACSFGHHGGPKVIRKEDLSSKVAIKLCSPLQGPTLPQGYSHTLHKLATHLTACQSRSVPEHNVQTRTTHSKAWPLSRNLVRQCMQTNPSTNTAFQLSHKGQRLHGHYAHTPTLQNRHTHMRQLQT